MPVSFGSSVLGRVIMLAAVIVTTGAGTVNRATQPATSLDFARTFATLGEATEVHARIRYRTGNEVHHLDLWRVGERLLRRDTDDTLTSIASRSAGDPNFHLLILDRKRHIATTVDRANLYRVGNFSDWFDLGHGVRFPKAGYRLTRISAVAGMPATPLPCKWYSLASGHRAVQICWSSRAALPMLIVGNTGHLAWRVDAIDRDGFDTKRFAPDIRDYVQTDASRDISGD